MVTSVLYEIKRISSPGAGVDWIRITPATTPEYGKTTDSTDRGPIVRPVYLVIDHGYRGHMEYLYFRRA